MFRMTVLMAIGLLSSTVYVSPIGWDSNTGLSPTVGSSSGPVLTIQHAIDLVRGMPGTHTVEVAAGKYVVTAPIQLTAADSGLTLEGAAGALPIILGSQQITGFQKVSGGWWEAPVPAGMTFSQLYVNGNRRLRPRVPSSGYLYVGGVGPVTDASGATSSFQCNPGDLNPSVNYAGAEAYIFNTWNASEATVASVSNNTVTLTAPTGTGAAYTQIQQGHRYFLENVRAAFGNPGDWYLDTSRSVLMVMPEAGDDMTTAEVRAPVVQNLLQVEGNHLENDYATNISIQNLSFRQTAYSLPAQGRQWLFGAMDLTGALQFTDAQTCTINDCQLEQCGGYAIEFDNGCNGMTVTNNVMSDEGGGGVKSGSVAYTTATSLWTQNVTIEDNLIQSVGRIHPDAPAIVISQSPNNLIRHNTIQDTYFTPIYLPGTSNYGPSLEYGEAVSDNFITQVGQGELSDMGLIYLSGVSPGSWFIGNIGSNVTCDPQGYGGWGIYLDQGASDVDVERNVISNVSSSGFYQNYGEDNVIKNNIFANGMFCDVGLNTPENHLSFTFEHNILYGSSYNVFRGTWTGADYVMDYNVYWHPTRTPVWNGDTFAGWQATGHDTHSVYSDPLFVNAANGNFNLQAGSPATSLGMSPIQISGAGITWTSHQPFGPQTMPVNSGAASPLRFNMKLEPSRRRKSS